MTISLQIFNETLFRRIFQTSDRVIRDDNLKYETNDCQLYCTIQKTGNQE